jgi:ArsR family transcriptional regulator
LPSLPDLFQALADPTRLRILRVLDGAELSVNELVDVLLLPQPTASRHLGVLLRAGLVDRRRDGLWTFYSWKQDRGGPANGDLAGVVRSRLRGLPDDRGDLGRLSACLAARAAASHDFYARVASKWDELRAGLDLEGLHLSILGGILPPALDLVDAGTGTGALLPVLAPAARRLVGVDRSPEMLDRARARVVSEGLRSVLLLRADLEALPLAGASVDGVASLLALHHAARPQAAVAELARIVRPGGSLVLSDLVEHREEWLREELAHLWLGFAPERVAGWCTSAGLVEVQATTLRRRRSPGAPAAPDLWVIRGRRTA